MFASHPVRKVSTPSAFQPLGLSLEKYLHLFSRVSSFDLSVSSIVEPLDLGGLPRNLSEALSALDNQSSFSINTGIGKTSRVSLENSATVSGFCPRFTFSNGEVSIIIDFGRTSFFFGRFYPWIEVDFANGVSSSPTGRAVGSILLFDQTLALYSPDSYSSIIASGRITERASFDEFKLLGISNRLARFSGATDYSEYTECFLNDKKCTITFQGDSASVEIPDGASSGHLRLVKPYPFDQFLSVDWLRL